jgi:hypothetical protein
MSPRLRQHLELVRRHLLALRDALALAYALGRILVLPRLPCLCDRSEGPLVLRECKYEASELPTPFVCPLTHIIDIVRFASISPDMVRRCALRGFRRPTSSLPRGFPLPYLARWRAHERTIECLHVRSLSLSLSLCVCVCVCVCTAGHSPHPLHGTARLCLGDLPGVLLPRKPAHALACTHQRYNRPGGAQCRIDARGARPGRGCHCAGHVRCAGACGTRLIQCAGSGACHRCASAASHECRGSLWRLCGAERTHCLRGDDRPLGHALWFLVLLLVVQAERLD